MPNFSKTTWKEDITTPITAAQLNRLETAISLAQLEKITSDVGGAKIVAPNTTDDVLAMIAAAGVGVHTFYSIGGHSLALWPTSNSIRGVAHITNVGPAYGWVLAFDSDNNIFSNYINNGTWRGWKIVNLADPPYLTASQTTDKSIPAGTYTILTPSVVQNSGGGTYTGGQYIVPFDGLYMVKAYVACTPAAGISMHLAAYKNGILDDLNRLAFKLTANSGDGLLMGSAIIKCVPGDILDVRVYCAQATTLNANSLRIARVG